MRGGGGGGVSVHTIYIAWHNVLSLFNKPVTRSENGGVRKTIEWNFV